MDVVDRARSAAAAARLTSEREVDVMTALLETKQKAAAQRRNGRWWIAGAAAAAAAVVVAGVVLALNDDDRASQQPSAPAPSAPATASATYGQGLGVPIAAPLPPDWTLATDEETVGFFSPGGTQPDTQPATIWLVEPTYVYDPVTTAAITTPPDYVGWVRSHPWLQVVSETTVTVDGRPASQLELAVVGGPPASAGGFRLHYYIDAMGETVTYVPGEPDDAHRGRPRRPSTRHRGFPHHRGLRVPPGLRPGGRRAPGSRLTPLGRHCRFGRLTGRSPEASQEACRLARAGF